MRQSKFSILFRDIEGLNPAQIEQVIARLTYARQKTEALSEIEAVSSSEPLCPHCFGTSRQRWGRTKTGAQRYRCGKCRKTYSGRTGSVIARLHRPDLFLCVLKDMLETATPLSVRKLANQLGINKHTIWRWRMLILRLLPMSADPHLAGILEADETYQRESRKGSREWVHHFADPATFPAPPRPRWKDYSTMGLVKKRGLSRWQLPILTVADRSGARFLQRIPDRKPSTIEGCLLPLVPSDAILCSDKASAYSDLAKTLGIEHFTVGSKPGERVKNGCFHIQNVNSLHAQYKRFIRLFRGPATKYLDGYIGWLEARLGKMSAKTALQISLS